MKVKIKVKNNNKACKIKKIEVRQKKRKDMEKLGRQRSRLKEYKRRAELLEEEEEKENCQDCKTKNAIQARIKMKKEDKAEN